MIPELPERFKSVMVSSWRDTDPRREKFAEEFDVELGWFELWSGGLINRSGFRDEWLACPETIVAPPSIDPSSERIDVSTSLPIGQIDAEQPIVIDYSQNPPRVLALSYRKKDGRVQASWVEIARDLDLYLSRIERIAGLT